MKILMVDDEEDIRKVGLLSLQRVGKFEVVQAEDAITGLQLARIEQPDLILLDAMMPGMDGPSALQVLKQDPKIRHIPVVFMTARVQPQDIEHYRSLGAIGVISKPFDPLTLPAEIRQMLAESPSS
ncbi:response regulator [bacterium]|nr:response regulator [bacterium]